MNFKVGDRIELVSMGPDPDPIEPGTKGTVDHVHNDSDPKFSQVGVKWDNGRSLSVILGEDTIRKIAG